MQGKSKQNSVNGFAAINENFGFTMRRYFDEETNEWVDKALVVVDGKVLNPEGYWLIKKKVSGS